MPEQTEHIPSPDRDRAEQNQQKGDRTVDPRDLVYSGGYTGDPREIVENPAVTPQMMNEPGDKRIDILEED